MEEILSGQPEPPLYFANMKRLNRDGAAVLGALPIAEEMSEDQFVARYQKGVRVLDTRQWKRFQQAHLPGSWSIPLTSRLGSYLGSFGDAEEPYIIVGDQAEIEEVVRRMIRIGFDRIVGWFPSDKMESCRRFDGSWLQVDEVAADQVHSVIHREDVKILDVRLASEYQKEHVSGAMNVSHTRLAEHLDEVDKETTWHLMCETGDRSERTASFLASRGYSVVNLSGGMKNVRSEKVAR